MRFVRLDEPPDHHLVDVRGAAGDPPLGHLPLHYEAMHKAQGQPAPMPFVAAHPPRTAVVLAAGCSQRLSPLTAGGSKLLLRLGGVTIIERTVRAVRRQGVERIVVVLGHDEAKMAEAARAAAPDSVEIVRAQGWESGNGSSLAAAEPVEGTGVRRRGFDHGLSRFSFAQ